MIPLDAHLALTVGAVTLAGFVQSVTGFGFGLLSMALLPLLIDFQEAYFMIIIPSLVVCTMEGKGDRHHLCEAPFGPFRQMVPVTFSRCTPAG